MMMLVDLPKISSNIWGGTNRILSVVMLATLSSVILISPVMADEISDRISVVGEAKMLWQTGKSMVKHGEREIDKGRSLVREGRQELLRGIEIVEQGIELLKEGREEIQLVDPDDTAETIAKRPLERGAELIRDGNRSISAANRKISDGSMQIREGRSLIESGLTMMQSVERQPTD